eukprot:TRINITY_DN74552_c0_g1_i1.p1 TRINITY_DN74552_c0_g1~~TRINITY_DN74552_c0_g1_i1.p1  ORF type:complete len:572 (-),score=54.22 TRINITY_DN74552_c0_g1_i1:155-1753(-)
MYAPRLIVCDQQRYMPFMGPDGIELHTIFLPSYREGDNILKRLIAEGNSEPLQIPLPSPARPSIIFSTSGSTGLPKGVMYSSACVSRFADPLALPGIGGHPAGATALLWVSMRGVGGTVVLLKLLLEAASLVMVDTYPSGPAIWAELIDNHQISMHVLFGAAMDQMIQELPDRKFLSMRTIMYGGSCFAPRLIQRSMEQFPNANFRQGYGLTESLSVANLGPEYHKRLGEANEDDLLKMSSAGKPISPKSVFIEDLDQPGSGLSPPIGCDGVGQICCKSRVSMMGYFANPVKTSEVMPDGEYIRTGDIGRVSQDGFLYVLGRIKDVIPTYRGFNVTPRDVESVLYQHSAVGQAAVVGICHPSGAGEAVVAWVAATGRCELRAQDLYEHFEESGMPSWQMPDAVHVAADPLPIVGGKIAKKDLQSVPFRQAAIATEILRAVTELRRHAVTTHEVIGELQAFLHELSPDDAFLSSADTRHLFGTSAEQVIAALSCIPGGTGVTLVALRGVLVRMTKHELASFLLLARSVLPTRA